MQHQPLEQPQRLPLPQFADALPLGPDDGEFIQDLYAVLEQHGNVGRFGLCLLHDHFPMRENEILLETHDVEARTLSLRVVDQGEMAGAGIKSTSWRLELPNRAIALTGCAEDKCKSPVAVALTGCAEDKCKSPVVVALTGCAEDKCK